eukprot:257523-Amphidinium_carterae.1
MSEKLQKGGLSDWGVTTWEKRNDTHYLRITSTLVRSSYSKRKTKPNRTNKNRQNQSRFETWIERTTYDQGQQTQKLQTRQRIMNPTSDVTQSKQRLIKTFTTWRDEIYQYEETNKPLDENIKMTVLLNKLRRVRRDHQLLKTKLDKLDYKNVYIDNECEGLEVTRSVFTSLLNAHAFHKLAILEPASVMHRLLPPGWQVTDTT